MVKLSGLPSLAPEVAWVVGALRVPYGAEMEALAQRPVSFSWSLVLETLRRNAVVQLVDPIARALPPESIPPEMIATLAADTRAVAFASLDRTNELIHVLDVLGAAGVRAVPYKGPVLAQVAFGNL